jgi:hypothetical protein
MRSPSGGGPLFCALLLLAAQHLFMPLCFELSLCRVTLFRPLREGRNKGETTISNLGSNISLCLSLLIQIYTIYKCSEKSKNISFAISHFIFIINSFKCIFQTYMASQSKNIVKKMHFDDQNLMQSLAQSQPEYISRP